MKTNVKEINSYTRELSVEVNWENLEDKFRKSFNKFRAGYSRPGFRKGHVPEKIIKQNFGGAIEADFAEHSLNEFYKKALEELELNPLNQAEINNLDFKEGGELKFTAKFEVTPEIYLAKYEKKFKVKVVRVTQTETDLNDAILDLQKKHGNIKTVNDGAREGHYIQGDFQEVDEGGLPIVGKKYEKQYICLGEGVFSGPGLLPLEGIKSGEKAVVTVDYKEGNTIRYEIAVSRVEEQILPELDDDFAKTVDETVNNIEELKTKMKVSIKASLNREFEKQVEQQITNHLVDKSKVDVPESMRENYLKNIIEEMKQQNGTSESVNEEEIRKIYADSADWNIRWYLIRKEIIRLHEFDGTDEEVNNRIQTAADNSKLSLAKVKSFYNKPENRSKLVDDIVNEKLFTYLKEFVTVQETTKTTDEIRKEKSQNG